jgi:PEP-CTERM motif
MQTKCLSKFALACVLTLSPVVAEAASPPLYGLSKVGAGDELFSYDLSQISSPFFLGYQANSLAPLDQQPFDNNTISSIAVSGNTLYGLSKVGAGDELFSYDLSQISSPFFMGYQSTSLAPLEQNPFGNNTITSIAVSGNTLYGLSKTAAGDELFTYDLSQISSPFFLGYESNSLAPLLQEPFDNNTITSIAVSGDTLYGLSKTGAGDELFTYDLSQISSPFFMGYESNSLAPLEQDPFDPNTIASIAIDGTPSSGGGGSGGSTPVPEPSAWALMMIGVLAVATLKGRRLRRLGSQA